MELIDILKDVKVEQVRGSLEGTFAQIEFDSRKINDGSLFVAVKGTQTDGHQFIDKAIEKERQPL